MLAATYASNTIDNNGSWFELPFFIGRVVLAQATLPATDEETTVPSPRSRT
jgi:hypothetical protein